MANRRNEKRLGCSPSLVYGSGPLYARKIRRKFGRCSAIPNFYGAVTAPPVIPTYASRTGGGVLDTWVQVLDASHAQQRRASENFYDALSGVYVACKSR